MQDVLEIQKWSDSLDVQWANTVDFDVRPSGGFGILHTDKKPSCGKICELFNRIQLLLRRCKHQIMVNGCLSSYLKRLRGGSSKSVLGPTLLLSSSVTW